MMIELMQYNKRIVKDVRIRRVNPVFILNIYCINSFAFSLNSANDYFGRTILYRSLKSDNALSVSLLRIFCTILAILFSSNRAPDDEVLDILLQYDCASILLCFCI